MQEHARRFSRWFLVVVVTLFSLTGPLQASKLDAVRGGARLIHTEPSAYEPVVVFEQFGERCMNLSPSRRLVGNHAINSATPNASCLNIRA